MKNFALFTLLIVTISITAQNTLQEISVIDPNNLTTISANRDKGTDYSRLENYAHGITFFTNKESAVVCCAYQHLSYFKNNQISERDPWFIHVQMDNKTGDEQRLIASLNAAKENGCLSGLNSFPYKTCNSYQEYNEASKFEAILNTMEYGRLQSPSIELIKTALDKGYPVITYFEKNNKFRKAILGAPYIWGDYDIPVGLSTSVNQGSEVEYEMGIIVGYEYYTSQYSNYTFSGDVFIMQIPTGELYYNNGVPYNESVMIRVQFTELNTSYFKYAVVPYNPCKDLMPQISGKDELVCDEEYSVNCPTNATVQWSVSPLLDIVSGAQSNKAIITQAPVISTQSFIDDMPITTEISPELYKSTISATFTKKGLKYSTSKNVKLIANETPEVTIDGGNTNVLHTNKSSILQVTNLTDFNDNDIAWSLVSSAGSATLSANRGRSITVTPSSRVRNVTINVTNTVGCAPQNTKKLSFLVMMGGIGMSFNNPADDVLNIQLKNNSENKQNNNEELPLYKQAGFDDETFELEMLDKQSKVVRRMTVEGGVSSIQMNLKGLLPDVYVLRLLSEGQLIDSQKVIVR